jgi:hypothetical protein
MRVGMPVTEGGKHPRRRREREPVRVSTAWVEDWQLAQDREARRAARGMFKTPEKGISQDQSISRLWRVLPSQKEVQA